MIKYWNCPAKKIYINNFQKKEISLPSWPWSYDSWIYNYLCNQCLSPLMLWVRIPFRRGVLDTTLCDKVCQWLATGRWFSPVSSTNKTDRHDITEILLKVALSTIKQSTKMWICLMTRAYSYANTVIWGSNSTLTTLFDILCLHNFLAKYVYKLNAVCAMQRDNGQISTRNRCYFPRYM